MNKIIKFSILGGLIWLCAQYMEGIQVEGFYYALIAAIVLSILNTLVRPILQVVSLPITILTFGLFSFAITAFTVEIMDYFVSGIDVASFWWALLLGLIVSFANSSIDRFLNREKYASYEVVN